MRKISIKQVQVHLRDTVVDIAFPAMDTVKVQRRKWH